MFVILCVWIIGWAVGSNLAAPARAQSQPTFTAAERAWIKAHPIVKVAVEPDWRPVEYIENGRHAGLSAEYLKAVERVTGLRFEVIPNTGWGQVKDPLDRAEVDLLPAVSPQFSAGSLRNRLLITPPYFVAITTVVTRKNEPVIFSIHRLAGKTVAMKGGGAFEYAFRKHYPEIELTIVRSNEEALGLVAKGSADATIGIDTTLLPVMQRKYFGRLHVAGNLPEVPAQIAIGVRKELPLLASIISKSLNSLSAAETEAMVKKWLEDTDYGEPTPEAVAYYYAPQIILVFGILILFAALAYFAMRARKAAQRNERDKANFLAIMGHEIRTPMHAILSSVELLQRTPLNEHQTNLSNVAITASESLIALLDNVLEFSKLEARKVELEKVSTAITDWAYQTVEMMRFRAQEKGLALTLENHCDENLVLDIDPTRLRQVVLNLLANAIKFTEQGSVRLRQSWLPTLGAGTGNFVIEVYDTGIGIAPRNQAHIFDAFKQEEVGTTRRFGGTGLGLTICRELVNLMGGKIDVRSEPGVFTVFTVDIPAREVDASEAGQASIQTPLPSATEKGASTGTGKILVVDDHEFARFTIGQQLATLGHDVVFAETGAEALQRVADERFDIILLDCDLPDIDGYTVAERIRDAEAEHHTPIIAISASTDHSHQARCITSGMDGVLSKPLRMESLCKMLEIWGAPALDPSMQTFEPEAISKASFKEAFQVDLIMLEEAIASKKWDRAQHAAHRIKGAARIMGHREIGDAAAALEILFASSVDLGAINACVKALKAKQRHL
ncbi:ATP-binding protein [Sphingopyxis sp. MWB1]|uniref:ATP-binding protein n=1 Tax=Sphingopyxis sp. MWB1 TaxID=1537715 RepID=UPI001184E7A9|nr:transporter substrate-binding domain-containing protein [Sphingopyxis sp. MWB1]